MGTVIFFIGFIAMVVSFVVALIQYNKLQRMDLTVMCFMLSLAVMVSGVTASVLDGAFRSKTDVEQERAAAEAVKRKKAQEPAPVMYVSWDESIYGGAKAAEPAAEPEQAEEAQPDAEQAEQPAEQAGQPEQPAQTEQPAQAEQPAAELPAAPQ